MSGRRALASMEMVNAFGFMPKSLLFVLIMFTSDDSRMTNEGSAHEQGLVVLEELNVDGHFFQSVC